MNKLSIKHFPLMLLLTIVVAVTACKKYETEPLYAIKEDLVWDELDSLGALAGWFLNDIYTYIPNGFNRVNGDFLDAATDDAIPSRSNTTVQYFTNGRINVLNNPDAVWSSSYYGIRRANLYIRNIYKVPNVTLNTYGKAEARFLRALFYFELVKRYGGVPLVGDTIFSLTDNLQLPRNSFADCVKYIASECDSVKDKLRKEPIADGDWGRIPRGAALALKTRVLLYAASPLFNGGGVETDASLRALTGYTTYDASRWNDVLNAIAELDALSYYKLFSPFTSVFLTKKNVDVILSKQRSNTFDIETNNAPSGYLSPAVSYGYTSPTQELVDAFPMSDGVAIKESATYNANDPYTNRDPRLKLTVFYNGSRWLGRYVQTYEGGLDKPGGSDTRVQTQTGYYLRKFMGSFEENSTYTNQNHNFILFRYTEILLSKAEALNALGRTTEAYAPLKLIRERAGIAAGTGGLYGLKANMTQDEMTLAIQNERRIELAFEEHRFWDIRRWKIAAGKLNGYVHGMKITKDATTGALTYQQFNAATVVFTNKMYHMPIPYAEISKNQKLVQNEGW